MEHPPKQGLKLLLEYRTFRAFESFNGTSTKTRIETDDHLEIVVVNEQSFNGTSTKTRIETVAAICYIVQCLEF